MVCNLDFAERQALLSGTLSTRRVFITRGTGVSGDRELLRLRGPKPGDLGIDGLSLGADRGDLPPQSGLGASPPGGTCLKDGGIR